MKMTPELEDAFYFGAAKAFLYLKIEEARNYARRIYGENYCELTPKERADCWKHSEIKFFIKLVRERRAACRAWVPLKERNCNNCMHLYRDTKSGSPCFCCTGIDDEIPNNWEPRKEGE